MKTNATKRLLALLLTLAMLLPNFAGTMLDVHADTIKAEPNVYDIYDLTGSTTNIVKGTDETWDGQIHANVKEEHKENIVFKTKVTMGEQEVRLSLLAKDSASIYDPSGYAVFINHNGGAPYIAIKRNMADLVVGSVASVAGTYELEIGIVDVLTDGVRTGKHLYVKKDGAVVCEVDDTNGYLTGDALGTKIVDFHYGAAIQMDTTYANEYGNAKVYDIYDLTGATSNTIKGTDESWDGQIRADISTEDKENFAFKTKLTMGAQEVRLSLTAKDGDSQFDPVGYAVYLYGASDKVDIRRNNTSLKEATVEGLAGTYVFEVGIVDILFNGNRIGKHIYVKINDAVVCEYDDVNGYLTGDALGTKIIDFHYGASIQMDSTYERSMGTATVYDIYDLTGTTSKSVNAWEPTEIGDFAAEDKEQAALQLKMNITNERHRYRFAVGNTADGNGWDPKGYGVEIAVALDGQNHVKFLRNGSQIANFDDVSGLIGQHTYEFGYRNITMGKTVTGKQIYLKVDGVILYCYDDGSGYLTGDTLGNMITLNHIDSSAVYLNSAYESSYGSATVYDIYDLTGAVSNTIKGTDDSWDGQIHANISAEHKENFAFKTKLTMGAQELRLSLTAKDGDSQFDPVGYAVYLCGADNAIDIRRGNSSLKYTIVEGLAGTYILEVGVIDILINGQRVGKHLYVKINDEVVCEYDDYSGYLTGDALGTKIIDFHYGASIQMDSTYSVEVGEMTTYDVWNLTGKEDNVFYGTSGSSVGGHDEWSGTTIGNVSDSHKENVNFQAKVTIPAGKEIRFSMGALDSANAVDFAGYALKILDNTFEFYRNNHNLFAGTADMTGTYVLDMGIQDVVVNGETIAKRITLKKDGQIVGTYDDADGYLTGDTLGTKLAVFHYGSSIEMNSNIPSFVDSYNLTLGGSTVMNLRLDPAVIGDAAATVSVAVAGVETKVCTLQELPVDAQGLRGVSVPLAAAQMRDEVTLTVTLTDGSTMTKSYTVAGYANYILNGEYSAEQKAVVEAMLHYGTAAQNYFDYNVENPANTGYTDSVTNTIGSTFSPVMTGKVDGVRYYGASLLMKDSISLRHYLIIDGDVNGYSFDINGEKVTPIRNSDTGLYYVQFDNILPNVLDGVYVLTVSKDGESFTMNYSPMSYIQRMSTKDTTKELVQQLYDYHLAAKELAASKVVDSATVLDLYQLAGKTSVTVPANQVLQLGVLVGTEDSFVKTELTSNVAIRFRYTGGEGMRIQLGASTPDINGTSGALFMSVPDNNSFGIANISDNGTWHKDAAGQDLFSWQSCLGRNQVSYIELGCVRRYTDGVYTHDRYYVRAASSLAELDEMAQNGTFSVCYDTTMKDNNGHIVIVRSRMDNGGDLLETTWTAEEIASYEARVNAIAQSATSGSYTALEKKYPNLVKNNSNTAASVATATNPSTTEATGGDELILWAESGTAKIVQDDNGKAASLASQKNTLSIQMAKNEDEGAQLMLFGNRNIESYEIFVTDLTSGSNVIPADNIRLYQLKYLTVDDKASSENTYDTPSAYAGEKLPDGMLPFAKAVEYGENIILAGNNQAIYVDVSTNSTDIAGTYTGTIVVKTNTNQVYTLPVSVTVENVVMPETSKLGTYAPYLGRDSFSTGELDGSDEMAALYIDVMQDFNMSAIIPASDDVLNIEKFLVNVRRNYDSLTNYLLPVDNSDCYYRVDGVDTLVYCNYALLKEYVVAVADMSIADGKNYLDKAFFYPSDHVDESITEAQFNLAKETYRAFCQMLDDANAELAAKYAGTSKYTSDVANAVKNLRFLLTVPVDDTNGKALDVGALLTEFLSSADRKNVVLCTTNSVLVRDGYGEDVASAMNGAYADELWTYLSLKPYYPYSNYAFDTPVVGLRTLGWTCYQENVDTLMAWKSVNYLYDTDGLSLDRWTTSSAGTNTITPGDGNMFYPGAKYGIDGPCPSLRAIAWRDGVDDYNLMYAVVEKGGSADDLNSLYGLITESYTDSIKASSETGSWWGSLISKNVNATVPIDDDAKFAIVRNALLQMAASDASKHADIISNAQSAVNGVVTATGTVNALEAPDAETTTVVNSNNYIDSYYLLADFETYEEVIQNKFSGNAQLALVASAQNGSYSLKLAIQPGQKGEAVWIPTTSKYFSATTNFSGASRITFKVYNAQPVDSTVRFYLNTYDRSGNVYNAGTYFKDAADVWHDDHPQNTSFRYTLVPGWNEITINAADIGTDYLSYVGAFIIAFDSGAGFNAAQVFYLDDVRVYMDKVS